MSHNIPTNLKYTNDHEWTLVEGDTVTIGVTDYAQSALGDIVFVELPEVGRMVNKGDSFGVVESIKSVSDLYTPLTGEVIDANQDLESAPESCNSDPYGAWMIKIKTTNSEEIKELLSPEKYEEHCKSLD
jgi:glycine cleavage system H protein